MLWSLVKIHPSQADPNSPGGDDYDLMAIILELDSRFNNER
jgi:hypothetical protein